MTMETLFSPVSWPDVQKVLTDARRHRDAYVREAFARLFRARPAPVVDAESARPDAASAEPVKRAA